MGGGGNSAFDQLPEVKVQIREVVGEELSKTDIVGLKT